MCWRGSGPPGRAGAASNHNRMTMKNDPLTTSADSTALAAGGAPAWAGGSQRCNGNSAVLARSPVVIRATAANVTTEGRMRSAISGILFVRGQVPASWPQQPQRDR